MKSDKRGSAWIISGLLLIAAALLLIAYNLVLQFQAGRASESILDQLEPIQVHEEIPLYIQNPSMEMPVQTIDGYDYIGKLEISALSLTLPVMSEWDYHRLRISPCRYTGSVYQDNLIICAHNYDRHFGSIKRLQSGDSVIFTDMDGNVFHYSVVEMEILQPNVIDEMTTGDWDLTLFTCTIGGAFRVTVRCERVDT